MPTIGDQSFSASIYVLREHLDYLKQAIGNRGFIVKYTEPLPEQTLVSAYVETMQFMLPEIIEGLVDLGIPYDIHRANGGTGYARFNDEGKYLVSATKARKKALPRSWDDQVLRRKIWATKKLINLIED